MKGILRFAAVSITSGLLAVIAACGGGGGAKIVPVVFNITTTTLADGVLGVAYNHTITVTGGFGAKKFSVSAGALPPGLALNDSTGAITGIPTGSAGTANFTITVEDSSTPAQSDSQALTIAIVNPLTITTTALPDAATGTPYNQTVVATGGTVPYTFSISAGALPSCLTLNTTTGAITGFGAAAATSQTFDVRVADGSTPQLTDTQTLSITINAVSLGRNDTIGSATAICNGTFAASISPMGSPISPVDPDEDYYRITTTGNSTIAIDIVAHDVDPPAVASPLDSVIEIVGANGIQLSTCDPPPFTSTFTSPCENDDETPGDRIDSHLQVRVVGATTFYVHVVDFRGDARPDLKYNIVISGVN